MVGFHPIWVFLVVASSMMFVVSLYESKKWTRKYQGTKKQVNIRIGILAFWGFLLLWSLFKAGYIV